MPIPTDPRPRMRVRAPRTFSGVARCAGLILIAFGVKELSLGVLRRDGRPLLGSWVAALTLDGTGSWALHGVGCALSGVAMTLAANAVSRRLVAVCAVLALAPFVLFVVLSGTIEGWSEPAVGWLHLTLGVAVLALALVACVGHRGRSPR